MEKCFRANRPLVFLVEGCKQENSQLAASKVSPKTHKEAASVGFARDPPLPERHRERSGEKRQPASQHLASDRKEWRLSETSGRHDPAAGWHPTAETGRHRGDIAGVGDTGDKRKTRPPEPASTSDKRQPGASVTASGVQRHSIRRPTAKTDDGKR